MELLKELYFREIDRKHEINNQLQFPLVIISIIIGIYTFILSKNLDCFNLAAAKILGLITMISLIVATIFLTKAFSNFMRTHTYREIPNALEILTYKRNLEKEQSKKEDAELLYDEFLQNEFAECAKHNFLVNKKRTEDMAKAKQFIFVGLIFTLIFSISYIFSLL